MILFAPTVFQYLVVSVILLVSVWLWIVLKPTRSRSKTARPLVKPHQFLTPVADVPPTPRHAHIGQANLADIDRIAQWRRVNSIPSVLNIESNPIEANREASPERADSANTTLTVEEDGIAMSKEASLDPLFMSDYDPSAFRIIDEPLPLDSLSQSQHLVQHAEESVDEALMNQLLSQAEVNNIEHALETIFSTSIEQPTTFLQFVDMIRDHHHNLTEAGIATTMMACMAETLERLELPTVVADEYREAFIALAQHKSDDEFINAG